MKTEKKSYISVLCCLFICCIVSCVNENDAYEQHKGALAFNISVVQINDEDASTRSALPAVNAMHNCVLTSQSGDSVFARYQSLGVNDFHNVQKATRGVEVTTSSFYSSFGVTAYTHTGDWVASTSNSPYVNNLEATSTNGTYMLNSHYWPGSTKKVSFFAYAPYNCSGADISNASGTPTISYKVPSEAKNQNDLLIASTKNIGGNGQSSVSLQFSHALCGVKFAVGTMKGVTKIDKIVISGVNDSGTIAIDGTSWTGVSGSATYTLTLNKEVSGKSNIDITTTTENNILFLMPQTVPSGATLTVTVDGVDYSMSIENDKYPKGGMVTYKLSTTKINGTYEFNITPTTSTLVAQTGGNASYLVKSYINYSDETIKDVGWTLSSITPGATSNISNGNGGTSGETITVTAANNSTSSNHTTELRNRPDINSSSGNNPYNLSNPTGDAAVINTANCYVIGRKGNYSIPLVYGNAIKDGKTNSMAYGTGNYNGTDYNSQNFVTHLDKKVIDPYIYNNTVDGTTNGTKFAPDGAELIWQDAKYLITSVSYNKSTQMVNFTVGENLQQGNAIIAVKQGTTVLWSWHIWITDRDMDVTVPTTAKDGSVAEFMQVPLGWCDASAGVSPRALTLSLKQNNSGYTASCITSQQGANAVGGNAPFYSWGRKDPICPSTRNTQTGSTRYYIDKMLYNQNNGNSSIKLEEISSGTDLTMGETIQNPGTFFVMIGNYLPNMYDLWNSCYGKKVDGNKKNSDVVKTIYDPSPVGYKIPTVNVFTGFTLTGANSKIESEWNLSNSTTINNGLSFYTQGWKNGLLDYWPTSGNRISYRKDPNGNIFKGIAENVGNDGRYWSADLYSETRGYRFRFWQHKQNAEYPYNQHFVFPGDYEGRATGTYVRPVKE